jgi:Ca-activated chloride channel family protein
MYLDRADPRTENPGGTAIGKALDLGVELLLDARAAHASAGDAAASADQVLVLLTDGEDTQSRPLEVAERAAQAGIRIFTVGIGSKTGEPVMKFSADGEPDGYQTDDEGNVVMTRLDETTLRALAEATKGQYVHASADAFGLDAVSDALGGLARAAREDTLEIHREEGYVLLVAPALLVLCVSLALGDRRRRRER